MSISRGPLLHETIAGVERFQTGWLRRERWMAVDEGKLSLIRLRPS